MITSYYLSTIIYACLIPVIGLLFLLFLIRYNSLFGKKQQRLFIIAALVNLALITATCLDLTFKTGTYTVFSILRRITSFISFGFGPMIPLLLYKIFKQEKSSPLIYIPFVLNVLICFISIFVNAVFFINIDNSYNRGPLFYLPLIVTIFYVLTIFVSSATKLHRQGRKYEFIFLAFVILCITLAIILEKTFSFYCMNYGVSAICLIAYYILKNIHYFKSDPLTGAYNRQTYDQELSHINRAYNCVIAVLDINDFKYVNDNYGHERGDIILKLFVSVIQRHTQGISTMYRIGGDEFVMISKKASAQELQKALDNASNELSNQELRFACGIMSYDLKTDIYEFINDVDKEMYYQKNLMKSTSKSE